MQHCLQEHRDQHVAVITGVRSQPVTCLIFTSVSRGLPPTTSVKRVHVSASPCILASAVKRSALRDQAVLPFGECGPRTSECRVAICFLADPCGDGSFRKNIGRFKRKRILPQLSEHRVLAYQHNIPRDCGRDLANSDGLQSPAVKQIEPAGIQLFPGIRVQIRMKCSHCDTAQVVGSFGVEKALEQYLLHLQYGCD